MHLELLWLFQLKKSHQSDAQNDRISYFGDGITGNISTFLKIHQENRWIKVDKMWIEFPGFYCVMSDPAADEH